MVQRKRDKNNRELLEKYQKMHDAVLASGNPTDWETIAKEFGYNENSFKTIYYGRALPALEKKELEKIS